MSFWGCIYAKPQRHIIKNTMHLIVPILFFAIGQDLEHKRMLGSKKWCSDYTNPLNKIIEWIILHQQKWCSDGTRWLINTKARSVPYILVRVEEFFFLPLPFQPHHLWIARFNSAAWEWNYVQWKMIHNIGFIYSTSVSFSSPFSNEWHIVLDLNWTPEAGLDLNRIPSFVRGKIKWTNTTYWL